MLRLPDAWMWDFWLADDGLTYHLFFLTAGRHLGDPELRHRNASIGHAVSADLRVWTVLEGALAPSEPPAFDDLATWTGSVLRRDDGEWQMFYTGISSAEGGGRQRVGQAASDDLLHWRKHPASLALESDPRWYRQSNAGAAWRDPWVLPAPGGAGFHMLLTAQSRQLAADAYVHLGSDPELSTSLALQALQLRSTSQAADALRTALPDLQLLKTFQDGATVTAAAFDPADAWSRPFAVLVRNAQPVPQRRTARPPQARRSGAVDGPIARLAAAGRRRRQRPSGPDAGRPARAFGL